MESAIPVDERQEAILRERTEQLQSICYAQACLAHNRSIVAANCSPVAHLEADLASRYIMLYLEIGEGGF